MTDDPASLDRLHDVIAPPTVPWWPPAPGWYWVLGFAAFLTIALIIRSRLRWQRNSYRREALTEWEHQQALLMEPARRADALASLAELLKRTALSAYPRPQVAALTGESWLNFLNQTGGKSRFTAEAGELLEQATCDPEKAAAANGQKCQEAALQVRHWVVHHSAEGGPPC
jgi:hypothetical protein